MSKSKKPAGKKKHTESRWLRPGVLEARRSNLFLAEDSGGAVVWTVYCRVTGQAIAKYWPGTGVWRGCGRLTEESGEERNFGKLFRNLRRSLS